MLFVLFACTAPPEVPADTAAAPPSFPDLDVSDQVGRVEGAWSGRAEPTPIGGIPFALTFGWEEDGSLAAAVDRFGLSLTFDFAETEDGAWRLVQTGRLRGGAERSYTLAPLEATETTVEWADVTDPDYLSLVVESGVDSLRLEAFVRGETHAVIEMERVAR